MIQGLRLFISFVENEILAKVHPEKGNALKIAADFMLRKSTKTLKAICELCSKHYGEDAQVLGRTVFENALTLTYICKPDSDEMRDCLASLYILHSAREQEKKLNYIEELRSNDKCKEWINDIDKEKCSPDKQEANAEEEKTNEALKKWDKYYVKYTEYLEQTGKKPSDKRSWSLMKLPDMCKIVGEPYECYHHFAYWCLSNLTHPSTLGSSSYYGISYPSDKDGEIGRALKISFDCYYRIVFMADKIFGLGLGEEINRKANEILKSYQG